MHSMMVDNIGKRFLLTFSAGAILPLRHTWRCQAICKAEQWEILYAHAVSKATVVAFIELIKVLVKEEIMYCDDLSVWIVWNQFTESKGLFVAEASTWLHRAKGPTMIFGFIHLGRKRERQRTLMRLLLSLWRSWFHVPIHTLFKCWAVVVSNLIGIE